VSKLSTAALLLAATSPIRPGTGEPGRCRVFGEPPADDGAPGGAGAEGLEAPTAEGLKPLVDAVRTLSADVKGTGDRLKSLEEARAQQAREIEALIKKHTVKQSLPGYDPLESDDPAKRFSMRRALIYRNAHASGSPISKLTGEDTSKFIEHELINDYERHVKTQTGTVAQDGGFLVGVQMMPEFVSLLRAQPVAARAGVRFATGITGNDVVINKELTAIACTRDGEVATITPNDMSFGDITLRRKRLSALTAISRSLLAQTGGVIQTLVEQSMAKSAALRFDLDYFKGAGGANIPLGVVNTAGLLTVDFTSIDYAGADQTTTDLLDQMVFKMKANDSYIGRPTFFSNPLGTQKLRTVKDANGNPILYVPTDMTGGDASQKGAAAVAGSGLPSILWGHPLFESTQLVGSGANSDLLLINTDDGLMLLWDTLEIAGSEHFYFDTNRMAVRLIAFQDSCQLRGISAVQATSWTLP
jgi:HK97 family phage major capsid protein